MNNDKYSTKALSQAGILTAITVILGLISTYIDVLGLIGYLIIPIPIAIIHIRYGYKISLVSIAVSIFISIMLMGPISAISNAIIYTIVGLSMGEVVKRENSPYKIILTLEVTYATTYIVSMLFYMTVISTQGVIGNITSFIDDMIKVMNESMKYVVSYYKSMGAPDEQLQVINNMKSIINRKAIMALFPSAIVIYGILSGYISYIICRSLFIKLRIKKLNNFYFEDLYISNIVGAVLIGLIAIGIILNSRGIPYMDVAYNSLLYVTMFLMLINGIVSVVYFLKRKRNASTGVITFIIIASILLGIGSVYSVIGFVEMMFDFRKLDPYRIRKR